MNFKLIFWLFSTWLVLGADHQYKLILHPHDRGAACLYGSPAAMYIHEGSIKDKFLVYFEGGGDCSGLTLH